MPWLPKANLLTLDELLRIVAVAVDAGVTEVRLTGGEPLLRPDIVAIVGGIAALEGPQGHPEVSMTTNGIGLRTTAGALAEAGLTRVNISLDTLRPDRFKQLSRRDRFDDTLAGIAASQAAGMTPLKLNTVLMRGINDDEPIDLLRYALDLGAELRFIEQMPLDAGHTWTREGMITADEIQAAVERSFDLTPLPGRGAAPAERFEVRLKGRTRPPSASARWASSRR
ncbi:GTP 3',8-cyclase MoaA [Propioniciclava coleopterorum]|uniref:GTP 3',8-cyclase MoaA n=1 Tax=Propioniciclava coleopterorum TaxID=2714937 RepID=UPI0032B861DE